MGFWDTAIAPAAGDPDREIEQRDAPTIPAPQSNSTERPGYRFFGSVLNPATRGAEADRTLAEGVASGRPFEEVSKDLSSLGVDAGAARQHYELGVAKRKAGASGISMSQSFRRDYMPFSSLTSLNSLPDISTGGSIFGGRVVGSAEYQGARQRYEAGKATRDDIDAIATYERHAEIDRELKKATGAGTGVKGFGLKLALDMGALGKIGAETMAGAGVGRLAAGLRGASSAPALAGAAAPLPAAAAAATQGLGQRVGTYALSKVLPTVGAPSMWVPMMQQNNMENGRQANDWKGAPTALGYGYANMLVLGQLAKGRGQNSMLVDAFKKGVLGYAEMQGVESAAGLADSFLPKAYQVKPSGEGRYGNVGDWVRAARAGSADKAEDALRDATVQMLSFSAFAAMHGREGAAHDLSQTYADTFKGLRQSGMTKSQAAEALASVHDRLESQLSEEPYLTKEKVLPQLTAGLDPKLKPYAQKVADAFSPRVKVLKVTTNEFPKSEPVQAEEVLAPGEADAIQRANDERAAAAARTRQPNETAATYSKAPSVAPVERASEPVPKPVSPPDLVASPRPDAGSIYRVPDYKASGGNFSETFKELFGSSTAGKWYSRGQVENDSYHGKGKFQIELDRGRLTEPHHVVEDRVKEVGVGSRAELYTDPALKAVRYKGGEVDADYQKMKEMIDEANEVRRQRSVEPITLEATEKEAEPEPVKPAEVPEDAIRSSLRDQAAKPRAGSRKKKAAPAPESKKTPRQELLDMASKLPEGGMARDYLESVAHNIHGDTADVSPKERTRDVIRELAFSYEAAHKAGDSASLAAIRLAIEKFGGQVRGAEGDVVDFHGRYHLSDAPAFTGDKVRVKRPGVVLPEGEGDLVARKADVTPATEPAAAAGSQDNPRPNDATPDHTAVREMWDSMDAADRANALDDPTMKRLLEDAGIDVAGGAKVAARKERNARGSASAVGAVAGEKGDLGDFHTLLEESNLSTFEGQVVRGVTNGWSLEQIGQKTGKTKQGAHQAGIRAVKKMAARALQRMTERAQSPEEHEAVQSLAREIDSLSKETKPASLEAILKKLANLDAASRVESRQARGTVEVDASGRPLSGGDSEGVPTTLYSGLPFSLSFLDNFFSAKAGGTSTLGRLSNWFFGGLDSATAAARDLHLTHEVAAAAYRLSTAEKDFRKALKADGTSYEAMPARYLKQLDGVLKGDPAARTGVPTDILTPLDSMRTHLDELSQMLISVGAVDAKLVPVILQNLGIYATRQYAVFRDPAWESKVDPAVVNRFKTWVEAELVGQAGGPVHPDRVEAETLYYLRAGTAADNPIAFLRRAVLGGKDLSILKARKAIPPELRALWGEYEDPLVNYTNSVAKMTHLIQSHKFLTRVRAEGLGKFLFNEPTKNADGEFVVPISDESTPALKPISGLYATLEWKHAMETALSPKTTDPLLKAYMAVSAFGKFSKVVPNPPGIMRNFWSNPLIVFRNGNFDLGKFPAAFASIFKDSPAARAYWEKLVRLGVVGEDIHYNDFQKTVEDALGGRDPVVTAGGQVKVDTMVGRMLRAGASVFGKMYHYGDAVWKVYAFENEAARYERAGMARDAAEAKAAEVVRDTMPTYSKLAPGLQAARRLPVAAPFISFQAEVVRTTKNALKLTWQELRHSDPKIRAVGAQRLAGLLAAAAIPASIASWSAATYGVDADEEKAFRRTLPDYEKQSMLLYYGRDEKGNLRYVDMSRTDPHAYISDAALAAVRNWGDGEKMAKAAGDELGKPFTSEELLAKPIIDIRRNRTEQGAMVYSPTDDARTRYLAQAKHLGAGAFMPGGTGFGRRLVMGATGETEQKTGKGYDLAETAVSEGALGQRIKTGDRESWLSGQARGFEEKKSQAVKIVNDMIKAKGSVTPQELEEFRQREEGARRRVYSEFQKDVQAAKTLGMTDAEVATTLRAAGLSVMDVGLLLSGQYLPYLPKLKGGETERVRAGSVRTSAASSLRK